MAQIRSLLDLMHDARRQMDYLCEGYLGASAEPVGGVWRPPTDVYECRDQIVIKMEAAGLDPGDAEITVERDTLTIRGDREERCQGEKTAFHQMEIRYGRFEKRIRIHVPFDAERIKARIENGFLVILVPKADPPRPQKVRLSVQI